MLSVDSATTAGESLLLVRVSGSLLALPHSYVDRVLPAALPTAVPGLGGNGFAVRVGAKLVPLLFASSLNGEDSVRPRASDWIVLLRDDTRALALWVDGVEDLETFQPVPNVLCTEWVYAFHDSAPAVPVLDARALLEAFSKQVE